MKWTRVDPKLHAEAMKIISDGPREGEDDWDVIERANIHIGLPPRKRRRKRVTQPTIDPPA